MAMAESTHHAAPRGRSRAGIEYFSLDVEDVPAGGSWPDRLSGVRPQEQVQRHTVEQMGGNVPEVPILIDPLLLLGCGEVGSVLGRWEPLPLPARVRSCRELAAGLHRDLTRLEEVRQHTAKEVARWFFELVRRGVSFTSEEIFSVASLLPDSRRRATSSTGQ